MSRGAWIPIRTFSPMIASTDTSMSSPIMMLWLDFLVRTSMRFLRASRRAIDPSDRSTRPQQAPATGHTGPLGSRPPMARRSLRPQLNQIRTWVRQGRTDAWIAHQLEATVQQIEAFRKEHELLPDDAEGATGTGTDFDDEIDLRAEDDALIAAELEAAEAARAEEEARRAAEAAERGDEPDEDEAAAEEEKPGRRRGRRGGRTRARRGPAALEGTFDHGEEGYGLWLDPAVADDPIYAEHWAGHRPVVVTVEEEQIVIRRAGEDDGDDA